MRLVRPWLLCGRVCVYAKGLIGDRCLYHRKGGKDRVLGEVKWYSHPIREEPPESPFQVGGGCPLVFVLDTSSLRHLFKLRLIRIEPPAFHHSLQPAQARQHALRARERGVCGSRWTRLCENVATALLFYSCTYTISTGLLLTCTLSDHTCLILRRWYRIESSIPSQLATFGL